MTITGENRDEDEVLSETIVAACVDSASGLRSAGVGPHNPAAMATAMTPTVVGRGLLNEEITPASLEVRGDSLFRLLTIQLGLGHPGSLDTIPTPGRRGRVVRQRPAKPRTPVRFWSAPFRVPERRGTREGNSCGMHDPATVPRGE